MTRKKGVVEREVNEKNGEITKKENDENEKKREDKRIKKCNMSPKSKKHVCERCGSPASPSL